MKINREKLCAIADIVQHISSQIDNLEDLMKYLNLSNEDRVDIENAMLVTRYKLDDIRKAKLTELGEHVEDCIENIIVGNRY